MAYNARNSESSQSQPIAVSDLPSQQRPQPELGRVHVALLGLILSLAAAVRVWGITFGLPNSDVRPDEVTMIQISLGLLFAGLNPRFFHWPSLEFYVLAALYRIAFEFGHFRGVFRLKFDMFRDAMANPTPYLLVPRVISAAAGVLTVWLVYRVARELFDRTTALVAAFFIAVAYLHVRDSHFGVTDVPMTCLATGALLSLSRAFMAPAPLGRWAVAGVLVGLTTSTKYNGGVLVAVGLVALTVGAGAQQESIFGRTALRRAATFLTGALGGFLVGTPFAVLDYRGFLEGMRYNSHHLVAGHGIWLGYGWIYHGMFSLRHGLGIPLLVAGVAGIVLLGARSWRKALFIGTFPILYYLLLGRGTTVFVRYMMPVIPFLCITAAVTVVELARRAVKRSPQVTGAIAAGLALLIALPSIERVIAFDALLSTTDTRLLAARWLDSQLKPLEWISETPDGILHPVWGRQGTLRIAHFDAPRRAFVSDTGEIVTPEWIVLATSPLSAYTTVPEGLLPVIESAYSPVASFSSSRVPESPTIFDQQDKFFLPYAEFNARVRPGPDVQIYRRLPEAR